MTGNGAVKSSKCLPARLPVGGSHDSFEIRPYLMPAESPSALSAGLNARTAGIGEIWVPWKTRPFIFTMSGEVTILDVRENVPHLRNTSESAPNADRLLKECGACLQDDGIFIPFVVTEACVGEVDDGEREETS